MGDFHFLKGYVFDEGDGTAYQKKHSFFALKNHEVENAESRIGMKFPEELKKFFERIGYGFVCNSTKQGGNRLMDPSSIADFRLGEGTFEYDPERELYDNDTHLVFFEVSEGSYLTMDVANNNQDGECPIYYFDEKIANSLKDFLTRMDAESDYYFQRDLRTGEYR